MTVASEITRLQNSKAAIKAAIEAKGVTVDPAVKLDGYAAKIGEITQGGGSGGGATSGDYLVRFIDYDGTILKEEWVNQGEDATPPETPTHDLLIFDVWNNLFTNIQRDTDIGAIYNTTGNHTYMWLTLTRASGYAPVIYLNKVTTAVMNIYNHNTNALLATSSASGNVSLTLNFGAAGDYCIRIECGGSWKLGQGMESTKLFGAATYKAILSLAFLGSEVTDIASFAFKESYLLRSIAIPKSMATIGTYAFSNCNWLNVIVIPNSLTTLGAYTFQACFNLKYLCFSNTITAIGTYAFVTCYALQSITIPNSVTTIGNYAFATCYGLRSVTIPNSVASTGNNTFQTCLSLHSINISVKAIGSYAFQGCISLQSITIPSSVTSIAANAFQSETFCNEYIINATTPPTLAATSAFTGIISTCKIRVPVGTLAAYKAATNWATYASYMVEQD